MPRIASLTISSSDGHPEAGLKAQVFRQEFDGCDLLVGPNGAGKTTRGPLGITATLEGLATVPTDPRRPYVGTLPASTAITLALDTGETVYRDLSASRGKAVDEANQQARDVVGVPPTAWDLSDFAGGTDGDRGRILDLVARTGGQIGAWDRADTIKHTRGLMHADHTGALDDCAAAISAAPTGADWIKAAVLWAESKQTEANALQKAAWAKCRTEAPPAVDGDDRADAERADELRAEKARIQSVDATAAARHDAEGARLAATVARITDSGRGYAAIPPIDPSYQSRVDAARAVVAPDLAPLEAAATAAAAAAATTAAQANTARLAWERASAAQTRATATAETLRQLDTDSACVHCGAADPLGFGQRIADAAEALAAATAEQVARAAERDQTAAAAKADESARLARVADLDAARRAAPDPQALARAVADLTREEQRHAEATSRRDRELAALRQQLTEARAAHAAWSAFPRPADVVVDTARIAAIDAELATITARTRARIGHDQLLATMRHDLSTAQTTEARWKALVALVAALRQTRDDMAAAAYSPIEVAARSLTAGVDGLPVPYFAGPDDYGAEVRGRRVPYAGLSESEQRITGAALVFALAVIGGRRVRVVLLDGIEVVTEDHRLPLLAALARAVREGRVDSVVCTMAGVAGPEYDAVEGLTIHRIEPTTTTTTPAVVASDDMPF